jgi:hypothetical protein
MELTSRTPFFFCPNRYYINLWNCHFNSQDMYVAGHQTNFARVHTWKYSVTFIVCHVAIIYAYIYELMNAILVLKQSVVLVRICWKKSGRSGRSSGGKRVQAVS